MKPLFFVGNVRSGTSMMVRILNEHPNVYVSHESDILWILYQYSEYGELKHRSFGGQKAIKYTMKNFSKYLNPEKSVQENFIKVQKKLMKHGSLWLPAMEKKELSYIGDKSPNLFVVDDDFFEFVKFNFPDSVYIHLVRHPKDFVASIKKRRKAYLYFGNNDDAVLRWWIMAEKKVIELKKKIPIISITYKELCRDTNKIMNNLFKLLNIKGLKIKDQSVRTHKDFSMELPIEAMRMVDMYGL